MSSNPTNPRRQHTSTYFVDRSNLDEMKRLTVQDQLMTAGMGGVLPEQSDPADFQRILDVACGIGGWLIEAAKTYPHMTRLVGVDVNRQMIEYAREQAKAEQLQDRVEFHVMDALLYLEFPKGYFDLVNTRCITSFMRTWNWPKLLEEMQRITRPGGVMRITEIAGMDAKSAALMRLVESFGDALYKAGHLFTEGQTEETSTRGTGGVASDLVRLLEQYGVQNVETRASKREFLADTPDVQGYAEDMRLGFRTLVPFIRKWSRLPENYEELYQQMLRDMQQPDFTATWHLLTAWGNKPSLKKPARATPQGKQLASVSAPSPIPTSSESGRKQYSTYFVEDTSNEEELLRLQIQDKMITEGMGGILPELPDPTRFRNVLDVGCGTGGWAIQAATTYPSIAQIVGTDISERFLQYARSQAEAAQVADRVQFRIMDALHTFDFPDNSFDLVNMRFASSFLRTWDWSNVLRELLRVARPGAVVRVTEYDLIFQSTSPALTRFAQLIMESFYRAGHYFSLNYNGVTNQLPALMKDYKIQNVQTQVHTLIHRAGTPQGQHFYDDMSHLFRTLLPFIEQWGWLPDDPDDLYQRLTNEMQKPDFVAPWRLLTAWGTKSSLS